LQKDEEIKLASILIVLWRKMTEEKDDWRLTNQENYLKGVTLVHRKYNQSIENPNLDHDHCCFCWAKFSLFDDPEFLKEGYATTDGYHWICSQCFEDFKDRFQWAAHESTEK
jgi:hypothetical protein